MKHIFIVYYPDFGDASPMIAFSTFKAAKEYAESITDGSYIMIREVEVR